MSQFDDDCAASERRLIVCAIVVILAIGWLLSAYAPTPLEQVNRAFQRITAQKGDTNR